MQLVHEPRGVIVVVGSVVLVGAESEAVAPVAKDVVIPVAPVVVVIFISKVAFVETEPMSSEEKDVVAPVVAITVGVLSPTTNRLTQAAGNHSQHSLSSSNKNATASSGISTNSAG